MAAQTLEERLKEVNEKLSEFPPLEEIKKKSFTVTEQLDKALKAEGELKDDELIAKLKQESDYLLKAIEEVNELHESINSLEGKIAEKIAKMSKQDRIKQKAPKNAIGVVIIDAIQFNPKTGESLKGAKKPNVTTMQLNGIKQSLAYHIQKGYVVTCFYAPGGNVDQYNKLIESIKTGGKQQVKK